MFKSDTPVFEWRGPWGIPVQIGGSFILLPLIYVSFYGTPISILYDLIFCALLVGSILLHELGHAWGCLIQGVPVRRIMLHGGGGFCERSRSANRYEQELIVAMGPIVNLGLWAGATLLGTVFSGGDLGWMIDSIAWINLYLAVFNLMPIRPLDGGKLFELIAARFLAPRTATRIAGIVGLLTAVLWLPMLLIGYLWLGMLLVFMPSIRENWAMVSGRG